MSQSEQYFRKLLLKSLGRLTRYVETDAPGVLVGEEMARALWHATGLCGPEVWAAISKRVTADVRMGGGFCQHCDTRMPAEETIKPVCESCEKEELRREAEHDD